MECWGGDWSCTERAVAEVPVFVCYTQDEVLLRREGGKEGQIWFANLYEQFPFPVLIAIAELYRPEAARSFHPAEEQR